MKKFFTIIIIFFSSISSVIASDIVNVKFVHGSVTAKLVTGESKTVMPNQNYPEGTIFKTANSSFIKLVFIDKSEMIMAPNSLIKIASFSSKNAGIIHLIKGIIRSKVTKDYMDIDDKNKSKLLIRTNYAALGIRGTYFQVEYNDESESTLLHMLQGKVAMNKIDEENQRKDLNQDQLDKILNEKESVMVTKGFVAKIEKNDSHPKPPSNFNLNKLNLNDKKFDLPKPNDRFDKKNKEELLRDEVNNEFKERKQESHKETSREDTKREDIRPINRRDEMQQMKNGPEKK